MMGSPVTLAVRLALTTLLVVLTSVNPVEARVKNPSPSATVRNGTYIGQHNAHYDVDAFLGVPFAQPPTGSLRLALPASLNSSFSGTRNATELQPSCIQFMAATIDRPISEDCLTLNVYRPSGYEKERLPVLVWIFGGGFTQGTNSDPRYNLTFLVNNSVKMDKPIVAVGINYRLNGFGFLESPVMREAGLSNIGLHDQRLALSWIQENIRSFGGEPASVTIWGQSAGGMSVGAHLLAYGGRNDALFHGAIADSGGPGSISPPSANESAETWDSMLSLTGCSSAEDALHCLRSVDTANYTQAVNQTGGSFGPVFDGAFLPTYSSEQLRNGDFLRVPLLSGSNTDEGTEFIGDASYIGGLPSTPYPDAESFREAVRSNIAANASQEDAALAALEVLYPDIPAIGAPHSHHGRLNTTFGAQYARVASFVGDAKIHRGRRLASQMWTKHGVPTYSYLFDQWPIGGLPDTTGATHFTEIQLVMDNEEGNGYLAPWYPAGSEFAGQGEGFTALAKLMSRMWISFVHDHDPNFHGIPSGSKDRSVPQWRVYADTGSDALDGYGVNMRFLVTDDGLATVEEDTWRAEAIAYMNEHSQGVFST